MSRILKSEENSNTVLMFVIKVIFFYSLLTKENKESFIRVQGTIILLTKVSIVPFIPGQARTFLEHS